MNYGSTSPKRARLVSWCYAWAPEQSTLGYASSSLASGGRRARSRSPFGRDRRPGGPAVRLRGRIGGPLVSGGQRCRGSTVGSVLGTRPASSAGPDRGETDGQVPDAQALPGAHPHPARLPAARPVEARGGRGPLPVHAGLRRPARGERGARRRRCRRCRRSHRRRPAAGGREVGLARRHRPLQPGRLQAARAVALEVAKESPSSDWGTFRVLVP